MAVTPTGNGRGDNGCAAAARGENGLLSAPAPPCGGGSVRCRRGLPSLGTWGFACEGAVGPGKAAGRGEAGYERATDAGLPGRRLRWRGGATIKLSRLWGGGVFPLRPALPEGLSRDGAVSSRRRHRAGCWGFPRRGSGFWLGRAFCLGRAAGGGAAGTEEGRPAPLAALTFPARSRAAAADSRVVFFL